MFEVFLLLWGGVSYKYVIGAITTAWRRFFNNNDHRQIFYISKESFNQSSSAFSEKRFTSEWLLWNKSYWLYIWFREVCFIEWRSDVASNTSEWTKVGISKLIWPLDQCVMELCFKLLWHDSQKLFGQVGDNCEVFRSAMSIK